LKFVDSGRHIIYFSAIPDENKMPEKGIERAYSVFGFHVFEKLTDGRILFSGLMQTDLNLTGAMGKIGAATALNQMPKTIKSWCVDLEKYVREKMGPQEEGNTNNSYILD
jgi:hypothetical protein